MSASCHSIGRHCFCEKRSVWKMIFDNGFVDWPQLLEDAGLRTSRFSR
jgi:hypothetical protein